MVGPAVSRSPIGLVSALKRIAAREQLLLNGPAQEPAHECGHHRDVSRLGLAEVETMSESGPGLRYRRRFRTADGAFAERVTHPRYELERAYESA